MTPYWSDGQATLYHGEAAAVLRELSPESVHMCVTSPPYYQLRDYQVAGQIGLEKTPDEYVSALVAVFGALRRVLRHDGTLWLNIGDSYAGGGNSGGDCAFNGLKRKNLIGIPWMLAFALRAEGWWLRAEIIWSKRAPMPESVSDRPTSAHETIFLLSKRARYFYDAEAVCEPAVSGSNGSTFTAGKTGINGMGRVNHAERVETNARNIRDVWHLSPEPYPAAHFATFVREIPRRAILAGTSAYGVCAECGAPWRRLIERVPTGETMKMPSGWKTGLGGHGSFHPNGREVGATGIPVTVAQTIGWQPACSCGAPVVPATVLDPFIGSGTTAVVAKRLGRRSIGIDLNDTYLRDHCIPRLAQQAMFFQEAAS